MPLLPWPSVVEQVAEPPVSTLAPQPGMVTPLAVNATVPVGVPLPEVTVAVKATALELFDGFVLLLMTVVVGVAAE